MGLTLVHHHAVAPKWLHATGNMREKSTKHMSSVSIKQSDAPSPLHHIRESCHRCKQKAGFAPIHQVMGWLRCHQSFSLRRSAALCLRSSRFNPNHVSDGPRGLVVHEGWWSTRASGPRGLVVHEGWIPWCIDCLTSYICRTSST